jgi:hypothetical protein
MVQTGSAEVAGEAPNMPVISEKLATHETSVDFFKTNPTSL